MIFKKVPNRSRSLFPGRYFNDCLFDCKVFNVADQIVVNYSGGQWDYMLSEDKTVAFMALDEKTLTLRNPFSGDEIEVPGQLAGMIVTSYAIGVAIEKGHYNLSGMHQRLNDVISDICFETKQGHIWMTMMD